MHRSFFYSESSLSSESASNHESKPDQAICFEVLDIEAVRAEAGASSNSIDNDNVDTAVKNIALTAPLIHTCDILVAGGGMGGIAAALEASKTLSTILTEETSWLGGQMTSQGVSALDENKFVETTGACKSYLDMREAIRQAYRDTGKLTDTAASDPLLHPGQSWVTRLAFEPEMALPVLDNLLLPRVKSGNLNILQRLKAVAVARQSAIQAVLFVDLDTGAFHEIQPRIVIDATELGDLLSLAKIPYKTGSDSRLETGENHAPLAGDSENVQDFVYPFVLEYHPGKSFVIEKPADYDKFLADGKFSFDGYHMFEEVDDFSTGEKRQLLPFWTYRRLIDKALFKPGTYSSDVAMINWDSNDLRDRNIIDKSASVQRDYLALAKRLSLGFLYWLQTEAQRDDADERSDASGINKSSNDSNRSNGSNKGYPELKLVKNILGTADGLSMHPYIREARRLDAKTIVCEQDIVESCNTGARARLYDDSVGIGLYPVDIHGRQEVPGAAQGAKPFQIPLGALITEHCSNYIAACKNIGVTHITNGAYRLHPIEWAIGSAAGTLAAIYLSRNQFNEQQLLSANDLLAVQMALTAPGCASPVFWFDDVPPSHEHFQAIQIMSVTAIVEHNESSLSFEPDELMTAKEVDQAVARLSKYCNGLNHSLNLKIKVGSQLTRAELADILLRALKLTLQI
ncbi:FAD-dependent oxidoreductase [bacterium]|nr:FAD-dependent oxidoreductase [bacterium]MBP9809515.1 FAD-dependent oxidoreductase [bacterium]